MTSMSAIVTERYVNRQTYEKKENFTTNCTVIAMIFEDSVGGVIPVAVTKINKMTENESPHMGVNVVVVFCCFSSTIVAL